MAASSVCAVAFGLARQATAMEAGSAASAGVFALVVLGTRAKTGAGASASAFNGGNIKQGVGARTHALLVCHARQDHSSMLQWNRRNSAFGYATIHERLAYEGLM